MLLIKNYIAKSKIHGLGLFAGENIKKGTITWKFNPSIDILITKEEIASFPKVTQKFIKEYGSLSKLSKKYVLSADNTRFTNHSSTPNLDIKIIEDEPEALAIANRNIKKGEEIAVNYKSFDRISETGTQNYLQWLNKFQ
ncbi:MAG: SET domain-containing protein [Candidatus Moraniibacteriota bacterium]